MKQSINLTNHFYAQAIDYYEWTLTLSDKRTAGWLFVDSPMPTLILTLIYLTIVYIGPKLMGNRKPFQLNGLLIIYNFLMTILNGFIAAELLMGSIRLKYNYLCEPCRQIFHPEELRIARAIWWFYFSKSLEFCDTFFFILRKKDKQLTFLHVYHHSSMFPLYWIGIKFVPTGSTFLPSMVNSFIHILMYSYYGLSVFGPKVSKFLWWKKYLTILQLLQFMTALVLGVNGLIIGCDFPLWMHYALIFYMLSFLILFGNFYIKAYYNEHYCGGFKNRKKNK